MPPLAPILRRHPRFASVHLTLPRDITVYQNLFEPERAHIRGQHWCAGETVDALVRAGTIPPVVLVGVDNTGTCRIQEYTPTTDARLGGGRADDYARFLIEELKPFVDRTYHTRLDPAGTALGGSSLGALVTLHIGLTRPDVFGSLVAMSPSVWWDRRAILSTVRRTRPRPAARIWTDIGTAEGRRALDDARMLKAALVGAGWTMGRDLHYAEYEGATHSETAWASRLGAVLTWLFPGVE
jgi:predicted alpha/beta superfamily hydrolase